jgi:signal transduction histidine kinase
VTTRTFPVTFRLGDRSTSPVATVLARIEDDELHVGAAQVFDPQDEEPLELARNLSAVEEAYVAGVVVELHRRDRRLEEPEGCAVCGAQLTEFCAEGCPNFVPWCA